MVQKLNLWSYTTVNYFERALETVIFWYVPSSVKIVDITSSVWSRVHNK